MLRSSGNKPVTRPDSTKVSNSPADRAGTKTSHWGASPRSRISKPATASSRLSKGARQRITTSSNGARRKAACSGRFSTHAFGNNPPRNVASNTISTNNEASRQATPSDPSDQRRPPKPRPAQPRETNAKVAPSWDAISARRSLLCKRWIAWAPVWPSSTSNSTRLGRKRNNDTSAAAKNAGKTNKTARRKSRIK